MVEIHATFETREDARRAAHMAVAQRLCASAHVCEVECLFRYKDDVKEGVEYLVTFKTVRQRFSDLTKMIRECHASMPSIYMTSIDFITEDYRSWIVDNTNNSTEPKP